MATGKLDSLAYPTFAALVAACRGPACPLSFLTFGNYSATGNLVAMSRVPYLQSLRKHRQRRRRRTATTARPTTTTSPSTASSGRCEEQVESGAARAAAAARRARGEHAVRGPGQLEGPASGSPPTSRPSSPRNASPSRPRSPWPSFKAGVCVSANLSIGQFDSHANNDADQMKLIPEFLAGIALPDPPRRGAEDPRPAGRRRPERDGPDADLQRRQRQGPLVDRVDPVPGPGHQGRPRDRRDRREAVRTSRSIRRRWPATRRRASGSVRSTSTTPCATSPASPTIRSAGSSRSGSPIKNACAASGVDDLPGHSSQPFRRGSAVPATSILPPPGEVGRAAAGREGRPEAEAPGLPGALTPPLRPAATGERRRTDGSERISGPVNQGTCLLRS